MKKAFTVLVFMGIIPLCCAFAQSTGKPLVLSNSEIRRILVERLGDQNQNKSAGIAVGIIEPPLCLG
jgi:hypothetical protein